jgi:hypothetical protein
VRVRALAAPDPRDRFCRDRMWRLTPNGCYVPLISFPFRTESYLCPFLFLLFLSSDSLSRRQRGEQRSGTTASRAFPRFLHPHNPLMITCWPYSTDG